MTQDGHIKSGVIKLNIGINCKVLGALVRKSYLHSHNTCMAFFDVQDVKVSIVVLSNLAVHEDICLADAVSILSPLYLCGRIGCARLVALQYCSG